MTFNRCLTVANGGIVGFGVPIPRLTKSELISDGSLSLSFLFFRGDGDIYDEPMR